MTTSQVRRGVVEVANAPSNTLRKIMKMTKKDEKVINLIQSEPVSAAGTGIPVTRVSEGFVGWLI